MSESPSFIQTPDKTKANTNPLKVVDFKAVIQTPSKEYDAVDHQTEDGTERRGKLKRASPPMSTVGEVALLETDEEFLLTPPRVDMRKTLDEVHLLSISFSRASLNLGYLPSEKESGTTSDFDSEVDKDDGVEEGRTGKEVKKRSSKNTTEEPNNKVEGNPTSQKGCVSVRNLDGSASEVEMPSMPGSFTLTPHSSFIGPIHTVSFTIPSPEANHDPSSTQDLGSNPSPLFGSEGSSIPPASGVAAYGTFPSPVEGQQQRKSNITQAILDLQRAATIKPHIVNSMADIIEHRKEMRTERRIMPKMLVVEDGKSGFLPTEATVTTAVGCPGIHSEMINPKLEAVKLMYRLLWPKEDDQEMYVYLTASEGPGTPIDPDTGGLFRYHDTPGLEGCEFINFRKRKRGIRPRTISRELHRPWRDDHSALSVKNLKHELVLIRSGNRSVPPHIDICPPRLCTTLDGQIDGPVNREFDLLFDAEIVAAEPPSEGFYCDECWNGKGECFCYHELRIERCSFCGKGKEFCDCWPTKRLRNSIIPRPSDPIFTREGRRTRSGTHWEDVNVGAKLGLRIGGIALRGGVDNETNNRSLKPRERERGRQRQRETEITARSSLVEKFGSPPKFPSPLKFTESAGSDGGEGYVDGDGTFIATRAVARLPGKREHRMEGNGQHAWTHSASQGLVPSELRGMQDAWMCVCGRCGGAVVCGLRAL